MKGKLVRGRWDRAGSIYGQVRSVVRERERENGNIKEGKGGQKGNFHASSSGGKWGNSPFGQNGIIWVSFITWIEWITAGIVRGNIIMKKLSHNLQLHTLCVIHSVVRSCRAFLKCSTSHLADTATSVPTNWKGSWIGTTCGDFSVVVQLILAYVGLWQQPENRLACPNPAALPIGNQDIWQNKTKQRDWVDDVHCSALKKGCWLLGLDIRTCSTHTDTDPGLHPLV